MFNKIYKSLRFYWKQGRWDIMHFCSTIIGLLYPFLSLESFVYRKYPIFCEIENIYYKL